MRVDPLTPAGLELRGYVLRCWDMKWIKCMGWVACPICPDHPDHEECKGTGWLPREVLTIADEVRSSSGSESLYEFEEAARKRLALAGGYVVPTRVRGQRRAWNDYSGLSPSEQFSRPINLSQRTGDPYSFLFYGEAMEEQGKSDLEIARAHRAHLLRQLGYPHQESCPCAAFNGCAPCDCGYCACERNCLCGGAEEPLPGPCWR